MSITKNSGRLLNLFSQVKLKLKQLSNKFVENIEMIDDKNCQKIRTIDKRTKCS